MKVECVEEGSCKRHLDVEIPAARVAEAFEQEVDRYRRSLKLPGFRKGKIPKELVKTRFRSEILNRVVRDLLPQALDRALVEKGLHPIDEPTLDKIDAKENQPLRFRASFEVMPKVEVTNWEGLEVVETTTPVTDEEVEKHLEALRERAARFDPVEDRGVKDGDFVMGSIEERRVDGGPPSRQDGAVIEVGTTAYHPALHETLQGAKAGDTVRFQVGFPPDHADRDKAGKTFDVTVEIKEVKEKVLPELDDEFAKDLGEFTTLDELEKHVREQLEAEARLADERRLRDQILGRLIEANPFEVPQSLLEHEMDHRVETLVESFTERGLDPEGSGIDWHDVRERQREPAMQSVKATILLDRLTEQRGLREEEKDVQEEIERIAASVKKNLEVVRAQLMKEGGVERLRRRLRREKAFDLLRESARIKRG